MGSSGGREQRWRDLKKISSFVQTGKELSKLEVKELWGGIPGNYCTGGVFLNPRWNERLTRRSSSLGNMGWGGQGQFLRGGYSRV